MNCPEPPPREPCDAALCGPEPGMPSQICPDGSTAGFVCVFLDSGVCGWQFTECPQSNGNECGAYSSYACGPDEYCDTPDCGLGTETGLCLPRPQICTREYDPVCGCDGNTYGNTCGAASAGMSVRYAGECKTGVCTFGMDQTCNDSPIISSLHGVCQPDGACTCVEGFAMNPDTGRCL